MVSGRSLHHAGHIGEAQCASQVLVPFTFTWRKAFFASWVLGIFQKQPILTVPSLWKWSACSYLYFLPFPRTPVWLPTPGPSFLLIFLMIWSFLLLSWGRSWWVWGWDLKSHSTKVRDLGRCLFQFRQCNSVCLMPYSGQPLPKGHGVEVFVSEAGHTSS